MRGRKGPCAICGTETLGPFCRAHRMQWWASGEHRRAELGDFASDRYDVARADFCRRIEAEERNSKGRP